MKTSLKVEKEKITLQNFLFDTLFSLCSPTALEKDSSGINKCSFVLLIECKTVCLHNICCNEISVTESKVKIRISESQIINRYIHISRF